MEKSKPVLKKKVSGLKPAKASPRSATDKGASFQEQIDALKAQEAALEKEYVTVLKSKLSDARMAISQLEEQMAGLTGKRAVTRIRR